MKGNRIFIFAYWHDTRWKKFVGATVKAWDLALNMARLRQDVVLFLPKYGFPADNDSFQLVQVPVLNFPLLRSLSFNLFLIMFLVRYCRRCKPDVVYIRRGISIVPALFARLKKAVLIYEVNDDPYPDNREKTTGFVSRFSWRIAVKTDEIVLSLCDAAFIITKEIKNKLIRHLPEINPGKLHILPSGTNTELYRPLNKMECRRVTGLDPEARYIGFMGTLLDHQGVDVLIDAAPSVIQSIPSAVFVVIGEGPMKEQWRKRVCDLSLQNNFLFTGEVDYEQTPLWINAMDVCTAPFLLQAGLRSPVKIFDYLACGRPVVASRVPGTTDIFDGSGAVRLVEPENIETFVEAVTFFLLNGRVSEAAGMEGRKLVETHYDRKNLAGRIKKEAIRLLKAKER